MEGPGPAPGPGIVPTEFVLPLSGPRVRISEPLQPTPGSQPLPRPLGFLTPWRTRPRMQAPAQQRRMKIASAIAGLVGLALISFLIALCASRSSSTTPVTHDASVIAVATAAD